MKKLAVIINGCVRDDLNLYVNVINSINTYLNEFEVHIYIHTWNPVQNTDLTINEYSYNQSEYHTTMRSLENVKHIIYDTQYSWDELDRMKIPFTRSEPRGSPSCQVRTSIFNCFFAFKRLVEYVKSSNIEYDYLLRTRNDLFINIDSFDKIVTEADNNSLCIPPNLWCPPYINDHWIFGKYDILINVLTYDTLEELILKMSESWNQEELSYKFLSQNQNQFYEFNNFSRYIIRYNRTLR